MSRIYGTGDAAACALDDVDVEFERALLTAVMGPSGSGKSTLMHCMAGLDVPTSGRCFIADRGLPSWMDSTTRLLAAGQQRGEIRSDYLARALAAVVLQAWAMSAHREKALGRPPGEWAGPSRSLGELAVEICLTGMRPSP
ncbi:MAG TPA: ATP-binding cassette domain-containing protein [Solirubrobacteraceae bacterium]|nr:ATP-binding cassette domain-containing protein [Solirubrobacteraceae bacterium]